MALSRTAPRLNRERGIFTFAEVLIATLILALAATTTAYWVATVTNLVTDADEQTVGMSLAKTMEGVVSPLLFREPGSANFGPEPGESLADFDDVDDFNGLVLIPPVDSDRLPLPDLLDWKLRIVVEIVDPDDLSVVAASDLRRVRVIAERKQRVVVDVWWLRARSPFE